MKTALNARGASASVVRLHHLRINSAGMRIFAALNIGLAWLHFINIGISINAAAIDGLMVRSMVYAQYRVARIGLLAHLHRAALRISRTLARQRGLVCVCVLTSLRCGVLIASISIAFGTSVTTIIGTLLALHAWRRQTSPDDNHAPRRTLYRVTSENFEEKRQ